MEEIRRLVLAKDEGNMKKEGEFHVALLGYNKKEVEEQVATFEANLKTAAEIYERKLEEQSTALSMALREKEKLTCEVADLRGKLTIAAGTDVNQSELSVENYMLKARIADLSDIERKNEDLISEVNELKKLYEYSEDEIDELKKSLAEKENIILEHCRKYIDAEKNLKHEIERIKAEAESSQKVYEIKNEMARDNLRKALNILERS